MGCFERIASKHIYYLGWNRSPAQVGCMRQVLRPGALGRPRGIGWRGRWEGESGWGIHVNPWLVHVNVWQNPLQYCKVISFQLIKINEKKKERKDPDAGKDKEQEEEEGVREDERTQWTLLTQWTCVWVIVKDRKSGMLMFMGLQRVRHNWTTEYQQHFIRYSFLMKNPYTLKMETMGSKKCS